jgi:protocatechuate 3,4-dioxygenase beta subunit
MFRTIRSLSLAVICCSVLVSPGDLRAQSGAVHVQSDTASIWGNVTDNHGSPLGGAKVTLVNESTKESTGASTDGTGQYRFEGLRPGTYDVTFEAKDLRPKTQRVKLKAGHKSNVSERLKAPSEPDVPSK